jgi:hypothetical protein
MRPEPHHQLARHGRSLPLESGALPRFVNSGLAATGRGVECL